MKPFNIELAKSGYSVCTRDGRPVRILCYDFISLNNTPIIGLVKFSEDQEEIVCFMENGRFSEWDGKGHPLDLMMMDTKNIKGYMNIYMNNRGMTYGSVIYETIEDAKAHIQLKPDKYINTTRVCWEELN